MNSDPERGSNEVCEVCGVAAKNQHTLTQSALCDGIRNGHITGDRALNVKLAISKNAKGLRKLLSIEQIS